MNYNYEEVRFWVAVVTPLILIGIGWGDLRRTVAANREHNDLRWQDHQRRDDERHEENRETLAEIRDDVKRINGAVARHDAILRLGRDPPT